jgi:hypothetical protein
MAEASMRDWAMPVYVVSVSALLMISAHAEDMFSNHAEELRNVSLQFLHLHAVPCGSVTKVESALGMEEIATCEDGREWALYWLENEVAFVQPRTRELYRWEADVYRSQPQLYGGLMVNFKVSEGSGP